ncbi:MAG: hypothetical protein A2Y56_02770 [Candidatus Aminicenantes bacterium RBG_13_63_10]|nr:MAG: hypothetical protein A2Y56_02770 [Candidatus Aminicenantes bacterium RBG_13_63_10]
MVATQRALSISALVFLGILLVSVHPSFPCHGKMRWRFLPREQALAEYARYEAELAKEREAFAKEMGDKYDRYEWTKYFQNPVLSPGPAGSWEEKSADCQTIGYYNGQYIMWYVGTPQDLHCQMGLATSPDGINWTKYSGNPVLKLGPEGSWDAGILICQEVLFDEADQVYKIWYVGGFNGVYGIGYATSPDGIDWTKYAGNPVMTITEPWEQTNIEGQCVIKDETGYRMWYASYNYNNDYCLLGYATSADGIHWTKHPDNPVFEPADPTEWDGYSVDEPDVHLIDGTYHMWYKGWKKPYGVAWIGHATSSDGIRWERDPNNPVLITGNAPGAWDNFQIYRPRILLETDADRLGRTVYKMWYSGRNYSLIAQLGYALKFDRPEPASNDWRRKVPRITQDRIELVAEPTPGGTVDLTFFTPWAGKLTLTIYDREGRKIRTLVDEPYWPGYYQAFWDRRDESGRRVPEGLYFCEIMSAGHLTTREIILDK